MTPGDDLLDGRYRIVGRLGSGGMGTVYEAHDARLDRQVALKLLRSDGDPVHRARLRAEARFAGGLQHPGIVRVFDYGEAETAAGTTPYVVMQLVQGTALSDRLRDGGQLAPDTVARLLTDVADALAVAHAAGVVHRDLKPSNILVTPDGSPVIVDFGVARSDGAEPLTETGFVVGTADYLSPEQAGGSRATPASDVYSLGVVAHQCLTGVSPFRRETPVATALAHLRDDPPDLPGGLPTGLRTLVRAMLARDPGDRPSAAEVAERAADAPTTRTVVLPPMAAAPPAAPQVISPWTRRRIGIVVGTAAVLLAVFTVAALQGGDGAAPTAAAAGTSERPKSDRSATPRASSTPTPSATPVAATRTPAHHAAPPGHGPKPHPKPHHPKPHHDKAHHEKAPKKPKPHH
ncbi:serine/threonine-protein kinase [Nocardioides sp.]|uniref:serine/threonine-protein kinase n=1 Tax=Nocardioides sp. TaxID=35761 RepID=UPI00378389A1